MQVSNLDRLDSGLDKISPLFSLNLPSRRFSRVSKETRDGREGGRAHPILLPEPHLRLGRSLRSAKTEYVKADR